MIATVWNNNSVTILSFYDFRNHHQFINHIKPTASCEICLNLIRKTPRQHHQSCSVASIVNFEHITHIFPLFLLFALKKLIQLSFY